MDWHLGGGCECIRLMLDMHQTSGCLDMSL